MRYYDDSFLKRLNSLALQLITAGRAEIDCSWRGCVDSPDYTRLYFVVAGCGRVLCDDSELILLPGNWYLLPSGRSFEYECSERMDHIFFHLKLCSKNGVDLLHKFSSPRKLSYAASPRIIDLDFSSDKLTDGIILRHELLDVILSSMDKFDVSLSETSFSPAVETAIRFINDNLSIALSLTEVSEHSFVSKSTLVKHFRAELGVSVGEYIGEAVLSEAARLVSGTKLPLSSISERLGFSDQFYFSKKFKGKYGISPREYRKLPIV